MRLSVSEVETSVLHPEKIIDGLVGKYTIVLRLRTQNGIHGSSQTQWMLGIESPDYFANEGMVVLGWGPVGGDPMGGKNLLFFR